MRILQLASAVPHFPRYEYKTTHACALSSQLVSRVSIGLYRSLVHPILRVVELLRRELAVFPRAVPDPSRGELLPGVPVKRLGRSVIFAVLADFEPLRRRLRLGHRLGETRRAPILPRRPNPPVQP